MAIIEIENMEFYSFHGCFAEESRIGTHFRVDLKLDVNTSTAQMSDSIEDTVNYLEVYRSVKEQMSIPSRLLEHVAERIASALLSEYTLIRSAVVKVTKLNPPLGGKIQGVSLTVE